MLEKYTTDSREKGIIAAYSTAQTENQHKIGAKDPSLRTNCHRDFIKQVHIWKDFVDAHNQVSH